MKSTSIYLVLFALSFFSFQNNSQAQNLRLGAKIGANIDRTSGDDLNSNFGGYFLGGIYGGVQISKIRVQAELLFSQTTISTGTNFRTAFHDYINTNVGSVQNGTFKMTELSIPVVIGINLVPKLVWLELGPQYTSVVSIQDKNSFLKETENVFKKGYFSGFIGLGLELPFNLNVGARYVMGISDRNNTNVKDSWRTNHVQVSLGYSFMK